MWPATMTLGGKQYDRREARKDDEGDTIWVRYANVDGSDLVIFND